MTAEERLEKALELLRQATCNSLDPVTRIRWGAEVHKVMQP